MYISAPQLAMHTKQSEKVVSEKIFPFFCIEGD